MQNRWYDIDPVVSLAVDMLQKSDLKAQDYCANYIIEQVKNSGVRFDTEDINEKFNCFWQRSDDKSGKSPKIFEAMEYLKLAEYDFKREISLSVINYIEHLEKTTN